MFCLSVNYKKEENFRGQDSYDKIQVYSEYFMLFIYKLFIFTALKAQPFLFENVTLNLIKFRNENFFLLKGPLFCVYKL